MIGEVDGEQGKKKGLPIRESNSGHHRDKVRSYHWTNGNERALPLRESNSGHHRDKVRSYHWTKGNKGASHQRIELWPSP